MNRDFLGFIHQLCKSNLAQVLMSQPGHLAEIIDKLKCGALGKDPVAAKVSLKVKNNVLICLILICFHILFILEYFESDRFM